MWSKAGSYPAVSCEGGLFETDDATWVLAVMAQDVADWGSGSAAAGPTLRAEVSRAVFGAVGRRSSLGQRVQRPLSSAVSCEVALSVTRVAP